MLSNHSFVGGRLKIVRRGPAQTPSHVKMSSAYVFNDGNFPLSKQMETCIKGLAREVRLTPPPPSILLFS